MDYKLFDRVNDNIVHRVRSEEGVEISLGQTAIEKVMHHLSELRHIHAGTVSFYLAFSICHCLLPPIYQPLAMTISYC